MQHASQSPAPLRNRTVLGGAVLLLVVATGGHLWHEGRANSRLSPPRPGCRLSELSNKVPAPQQLAKVVAPEGTRLVWVGTVPPYTLRSGPPCYVFDETCTLLDWTTEVGEGWRWDNLCYQAFQEPALSLDEAIALCPM